MYFALVSLPDFNDFNEVKTYIYPPIGLFNEGLSFFIV